MPKHLNEQLVDAACRGDIAGIRRALAAGADPNYQNEQINTPLMWAVTHRHRDAARVLLESGADVNRQDVLGGTALMSAASNGDVPTLQLLLIAGANPRVADHEGNTARAWASHKNHHEAASLLELWESAQDRG